LITSPVEYQALVTLGMFEEQKRSYVNVSLELKEGEIKMRVADCLCTGKVTIG